MAPEFSNPSIAFPFRLEQGLLRKTDEREAYLMLLEIMARTPQGSWSGHPLFGFREFFPEITKEGLTPEARGRIAEKTVQEINKVLADLGLVRYCVDSLNVDQTQKRMNVDERQGITCLLRENGSERVSGYSL